MLIRSLNQFFRVFELWIAVLLFASAGAASAAVDVASKATAGTGSVTSPWTGWDVQTSWDPETEYFFKSGHYAYIVSPNFLKTGIALRGEAGTVLHFNGVGNAVVFDNPGGQALAFNNWTMNVRMENFIIQGTSNATNGLFLRAIRNGIFRHISVRDVTNAGVWTEALVTNVFDNIRVTRYEMPNYQFNVTPVYGMVLGARGGVDTTTTTTVTNAVIEGVSGIGIWVKGGSANNTFINGTAEANLGKGMVIEGPLNTVSNMDFEGNGGTDIEVSHDHNQLLGVVSAGLVDVKIGNFNKLRGSFSTIAISDRCNYTDISGSQIGFALNDSSPSTIKMGYFLVTEFRRDAFIGNVMDLMIPLQASNGTIATDARQSKLYSAVIAGDTTLANPTNGVNGQSITWRFQQDSAGGHTLLFGSAFESLSGQPLPVAGNTANPAARGARFVLNPAPFSYTEITARYNAPVNKWQVP